MVLYDHWKSHPLHFHVSIYCLRYLLFFLATKGHRNYVLITSDASHTIVVGYIYCFYVYAIAYFGAYSYYVVVANIKIIEKARQIIEY